MVVVMDGQNNGCDGRYRRANKFKLASKWFRFLSRNLGVQTQRTFVISRLVQKRFHIHSRRYRHVCVAQFFSLLEGAIGKVVNANRLPRRVRVKGAAACARA